MHRKIVYSLLFCTVLLLSACSANREATKAKLLQSGNDYFERAQYREAVIMYSRAIQQDRRFGEAYYRLALAEMNVGRWVEAARALHRAVELQPENDDAFVRLCAIYLQAAKTDRPHREAYLIELKDLIAKAETNGTDQFEVLRFRGHVALVEEEFAEAISFYRHALELRPDSPLVLQSMVQALTANNEYAEAVKLAYAAIEADPALWQMYDQIYVTSVIQGDDKAAEEVIVRKCEANPGVVDYKIQLAAHYHRTQNASKRDEILKAIQAMPDKSQMDWTHLADFYERAGNFQGAIEQNRLAGEAYPAAKAYYQLRSAETLVQIGRGAEALRLVGEVLKAEPENTLAIALNAALRLYGGDAETIQESILNLEAVISDMPKNPVLRYNLGLAYLSAGDLDKAMVQFQEAVAMLPDYAGAKYQLGRIYLGKDQPAMAAQLADEIIALSPRSIRGRLLRANASIRLREYNQARANIDAVLRESPTDADAQFMLAGLYVAERNYDAAERILRQLYSNSPDDTRGIRGLIGIFVAKGETGRANELLDAELDKNPNSRQLRLISAEAAMATKDYPRAVRHYEHILEKEPGAADVHVEAGRAYYYSKDMDKAEDHFKTAADLQPSGLAPKLRLAVLISERGRLAESREMLQEILKTSPDNPVALNNVAYILAESSATLDTAQTLAEKAVSRAPHLAAVSETLAWIYYKKGLSDNAIELYQTICARYPRNAKWRYRYALSLYQKGNTPQARLEAQAALEANPSPTQTQQISQLLSQIGS